MAAVAACACIWRRSTDSPRFPTSGALRECEVRPTGGSPWTSRESMRGHPLERPAVPCDVGSSTSRRGESRDDARPERSPVARHGVPRASRAIAATAMPKADDQQWQSEVVDGGSDSQLPTGVEGRGSPGAAPRVNGPTTGASGGTKRRRTRWIEPIPSGSQPQSSQGVPRFW